MSTTTTVATDAASGQLPARPWQASIQASLTRGVGVDEIEEIGYGDGEFTRRFHVIGGPSPQSMELLNDQAKRDLLSQLRTELQAPPAGVDVLALEDFVDLLEDSLRHEPSHLFDTVRFGPTANDETTGIVFGKLSLGVDVVGNVRDARHHLTFEQHVVVLPPGAYKALSTADRASLAHALRANPQTDPNWQQILTDAER